MATKKKKSGEEQETNMMQEPACRDLLEVVEAHEPVPQPAVKTEPVFVLEEDTPLKDGNIPKMESRKDLAGVRAELVNIFSMGRSKRSIPTLVRYKRNGSVTSAYIIVNLSSYCVLHGWEVYKANIIGARVEDYLVMMYGITQIDIPRMYRSVDYITLK